MASSFWDHLDELRSTLIRAAIVLFILALLAFILKEPLFGLILYPKNADFITYRLIDKFVHVSDIVETPNILISTHLTSQFVIHLKTSFYIAFILAMPYFLYLFFRFLKPALYPKEAWAIKRVFIGSCFFFATGILVAYFIIFPFSYRFLLSYRISQDVVPYITIDSYISNLSSLCILLGLMFELPIVAWLLCKMGWIKKESLSKYRRHAYVVICVVAAIITPTVDFFTLILTSFPIVLLYELSVFIAKGTKPKA